MCRNPSQNGVAMTWRMNGLVAAAGTLVVLTFWYLERSTLPREDTIYEATPADWMFYRIKHEDLAGQVRRMVRRMVELQEPTEKLVESFNQETDLLEKRSIDGSTADDLVFGAFPPVVAAAAKYEADVAQEHPATILLPQNLLDLDQRATSRASLIRLR